MATKRALIVGGGVAGPVLALFLKQAGIESEVFEASGGPSDQGGGLGLAPNGMSVLAAAGVLEQVRAASVEVSAWTFENQCGKSLACMSTGDGRHGHAPVMITRAMLNRTIVEYAQSQGIKISYGKRLTGVDDIASGAVARFEDGATAEGDFLVGADGIRSQVRQAVMPDAPKPEYTGLMAPGGFSPCIADGPYSAGSQQPTHFVFGANGFFGHVNVILPQGPRTMWWSTASALRCRAEKRWRRRARKTYRRDCWSCMGIGHSPFRD